MSKEPELYGVNFARVLTDKNVSALTKLTVMKLKEQQYLTLAEFIQGLSQADLEGLSLQFDKMTSSELVIQEVILLCEIVASGEGDSSFSIDNAEERLGNLNYFVTVVTCESLKRKGVVVLDYSKITFDPAYRNEIFARIIE
jgi:hypothetical protein